MDISTKTSHFTNQPLSKKGYGISFHMQIEEISEEILEILDVPDVFLQKKYLALLEKHPPHGMKFCYLVLYFQNQPIGFSACQIQYFKADQSLNNEEEEEDFICFFNAFGRYLKSLVASKVEFNTLVCGNLMLTGEHGFYFKTEITNKTECAILLEEGLKYAQQQLDRKGIRIDVTLLKDFPESQRKCLNYFQENSYNEFCIQPSMVMDLQEEWKTFDDYLEALSSKYRVRVKRAFKKGATIRKEILDENQVREYLPQIQHLYKEIAHNAGFNVVDLNERYLLAMEQDLEAHFTCTGYFLEDQLIGFFTTVHNGEELDAHFLGYEKSLNHDLQIYLNMLYDIVRTGIQFRVKRIIFARTAMEIKSSVGATAREMYCYIRHRNTFANKFLKPLLDYLRPREVWLPRHPFKTHEGE